jgi:hypothetical protein
MASASTISALQKMFKTVYMGRDLAVQSKRKTPAFDKVLSKYDDFDGADLKFPFNQDMPVGVSPVFATAQANATASTFDNWTMTTRKTLYGFLTIDGQAMKAARKDIGAWLRLRQKETNEIRDYMKMVLGGHAFWGDGAGDLALIESVSGSPVTSITLTNKRDAVKFHKNQMIVGNATRTGSSGTIVDAVYQVTGINRGTGVLTVVRDSGASNVVAGNYLYLQGAYDAMPLGVKAFIPSADPGTGGVPASLLGMTRTDDYTMKSGWRVDYQGSIEETAKLLCADMGQYFDSQESAIWLSRYNWFRLEQELSAQGRVVRDQSAQARFGTSGLVLQTPEGDVTCVSDPYAPNDAFYLLNNSTWETHHLDPLIHVIDDDGLAALRQTSDDGIEIRLRSWSENICQRPFMNGRGAIT